MVVNPLDCHKRKTWLIISNQFWPGFITSRTSKKKDSAIFLSLDGEKE